VETSKISVDGLATMMATSLKVQDESTKKMEDVPFQVSAIRQHLQ
jgi:hypothetical protein